VEVVIANIPQGEEVEDLDHGKALQAEGGVVVFKVETVLAHLKADRPEITRGDVSRILRELGYQSRSMRFGEAVVRGWAKQ